MRLIKKWKRRLVERLRAPHADGPGKPSVQLGFAAIGRVVGLNAATVRDIIRQTDPATKRTTK